MSTTVGVAPASRVVSYCSSRVLDPFFSFTAIGILRKMAVISWGIRDIHWQALLVHIPDVLCNMVEKGLQLGVSCNRVQ
jgi:hypothetical protein